jgi:hypothetical protein
MGRMLAKRNWRDNGRGGIFVEGEARPHPGPLPQEREFSPGFGSTNGLFPRGNLLRAVRGK